VQPQENGYKMPLLWESAILDTFLNVDNLARLLPYFCKIEAEAPRHPQYDPITSAVLTFLTAPLQLTLTEVGAAPFMGHTVLVYPYSLMTVQQRAFLRTALDNPSEWGIVNGAIVFHRSQKGKDSVVLPPRAVLTALCQKVFDSSLHTDERARVAICNIILQRVQGFLPISRPVQRELNEWLALRHERSQPSSTKKETVR